jgi:D-alanine-D-alanine ligase
MNKIRVGVLRGGPSAEYDVSLKTGHTVLMNLPEDRYEARDIFIDKAGVWNYRGVQGNPEKILDHVDVVFNALHGAYGEDGTVQHMLDAHRVRYTGSDALGSAIGMNKPLAKSVLRNMPLKHAPHRVIHTDEYSDALLSELFRSFPMPVVVKPAMGGSSVATTLAHTLDELQYGILGALQINDRALVENYVRGTEVTVAVAEGFRGEDLYVFPPIEIVPTKSGFFDYDEKYAGHAREICPARLSRANTEELMRAARDVHRTLGLRDYSRSDFIVAREGIFFLEVNTLPGLTPTSLVPQAVEAVGATLPEFLEHMVLRALSRK